MMNEYLIKWYMLTEFCIQLTWDFLVNYKMEWVSKLSLHAPTDTYLGMDTPMKLQRKESFFPMKEMFYLMFIIYIGIYIHFIHITHTHRNIIVTVYNKR